MRYYNKNTFFEDLNSNNDFRMTNIRDKSNVARLLETMYGCIQAQLETKYNIDAIVKPLQDTFECSKKGVQVLAVLSHYDGYISSPQRLATLLKWQVSNTERPLSELSKLGLINQMPEADSLVLTKMASDIIVNSWDRKSFSDSMIIECLMKDDDDFSSFVCGDDLKEILEKYPHGSIARFAEENGLVEMDVEPNMVFWLLCRTYVRDFITQNSGKFKPHDVKRLAEKGWIEAFASSGESGSESTKRDNYCLSSTLVKQLFGGMEELINYAALSSLGTFVRWDEIEEKELFFCESDKEQIERLERISGEAEYQRIYQGLKDRKMKASVSAILYGAPGTGKTELVRQIARKTRRNILIVDAAKMHGSYWGEDEKNYRELFRVFRHINALSKRATIMVIDEADGILGKRAANASTRADRSCNIVQDILLEELGHFEGLLFATTNIAANLDEAMDRRFLTKIEFHVPDETTRKKIWHSKMPGLSPQAIDTVAREFPFSGGHIDNVVTKACIEEILDDVQVSQESLIRYCQEEAGFSSKTTVKKIGF